MENKKNALKVKAKPIQNLELVENVKSNLSIEVDNYWWSLSFCSINYLVEKSKRYIWPMEYEIKCGLEPDIDEIMNTQDENMKLEKAIRYVKKVIEKKGLQKFYGTIPVTSIKEIEDYVNAKNKEALRREDQAYQESAKLVLKNTDKLKDITDGTLRILINQVIDSSLDNATMNEIQKRLFIDADIVQEQSTEVPVISKADLAKCLVKFVDLTGLLDAVNVVIAEVEKIVDKDRPNACYNTRFAYEMLQSITNREVKWYVGSAIDFENKKISSTHEKIFVTGDGSLFDMFVTAVYNRLLLENLIVTEAAKETIGLGRKRTLTKLTTRK